MFFGMIFLSLSIAVYIAGIAWCYWDSKNEERGRKNLNGVQCKKCRYLLKDQEGYNWCPNKTDDPDIELIRNCEWYAVKTNADRIRAMTDEELAEWRSRGQCPTGHYHGDYDCMNRSCKDCWLEWLKGER